MNEKDNVHGAEHQDVEAGCGTIIPNPTADSKQEAVNKCLQQNKEFKEISGGMRGTVVLQELVQVLLGVGVVCASLMCAQDRIDTRTNATAAGIFTCFVILFKLVNSFKFLAYAEQYTVLLAYLAPHVTIMEMFTRTYADYCHGLCTKLELSLAMEEADKAVQAFRKCVVDAALKQSGVTRNCMLFLAAIVVTLQGCCPFLFPPQPPDPSIQQPTKLLPRCLFEGYKFNFLQIVLSQAPPNSKCCLVLGKRSGPAGQDGQGGAHHAH